MAQSLYLFRAGRLRRQQNTLLFETPPPHSEKRYIPIAEVRDIFAMGPLRLNSQTLRFLGQKGIPVHVFTHYGTYAGTYWPRARHTSGELLIAQVQHAQTPELRLRIAQQFVLGAAYHMRRNLLYYHNRGTDLSQPLTFMEERIARIPTTTTIPDLMGEEGKIRGAYYQAWQAILNLPEPFLRERRPPTTLVNALVSFLNTLLYAHTLSEIYHTPLHPSVSFLHEPRTRRFSLALDLAEPFKPLVVDRLVFRLLNRKELSLADLEAIGRVEGVFFREEARKRIVRAFMEVLGTTVQHRRLCRSVSYRQLLRLEAYKLMRHLLDMEPYTVFKAWW